MRRATLSQISRIFVQTVSALLIVLVLGCRVPRDIKSDLFAELAIVDATLNRFQYQKGYRPGDHAEFLTFFTKYYDPTINFKYFVKDKREYIVLNKRGVTILKGDGHIFRVREREVEKVLRDLKAGKKIADLGLSEI